MYVVVNVARISLFYFFYLLAIYSYVTKYSLYYQHKTYIDTSIQHYFVALLSLVKVRCFVVDCMRLYRTIDVKACPLLRVICYQELPIDGGSIVIVNISPI